MDFSKYKNKHSYSSDNTSSNIYNYADNYDREFTPQQDIDESSYIQKRDNEPCTELEMTNAIYEYAYGDSELTISIDQIKNISSSRSGQLELICWITDGDLDDNGWSSENKLVIGEVQIGDIRPNASIKNFSAKFNMNYDELPILPWRFIFSINELSEDNKWYIIDYKRSDMIEENNDTMNLIEEADNGDVEAQLEVGYNFLFGGNGFIKDSQKAISYLKSAADSNNASAMYWLGYIYETGEGITKNQETASHYFLASANNGDSRAKVEIGYRYLYGIGGISKDFKQAKQILEAAANEESPEAFFWLARMYESGMGVFKSPSKAAEYYLKGAKLGDNDCKYNIGLCYRYGYGTNESITFALVYLKQASENGINGATAELGNIYLEKMEYKLALEYSTKAYNNDPENTRALNDLGYIYYKGRGVKQDKARGLDFYRKAVALGDEEAKEFLKTI
jgi:TPR repeat protein